VYASPISDISLAYVEDLFKVWASRSPADIPVSFGLYRPPKDTAVPAAAGADKEPLPLVEFFQTSTMDVDRPEKYSWILYTSSYVVEQPNSHDIDKTNLNNYDEGKKLKDTYQGCMQSKSMGCFYRQYSPRGTSCPNWGSACKAASSSGTPTAPLQCYKHRIRNIPIVGTGSV